MNPWEKKAKRMVGTTTLPGKSMFRDADKDGVPNVLDCQPYNPDRQGVIHDVKRKYREYKEARKQKSYAMEKIRKKARAAYYREKEKQAIKEAEARAKRPGVVKTFVSGIDKLTKTMPKHRKVGYSVRKPKKKKGKKTYRPRAKPKPLPNPTELDFGW